MSDDLTALARERAEELHRIAVNSPGGIYRGIFRAAKTMQALADDRERLLAEVERMKELIATKDEIIDHASPIAYAAEEWLYHRITNDDLRETVLALAQKGA